MLAFQVISVSVEIVCRYFFNISFSIITPLNEWSLVYLTFVGVAWLQREGGHTSDDSIVTLLPPWVNSGGPKSWLGSGDRDLRAADLVWRARDVGQLFEERLRFFQAAQFADFLRLPDHPHRQPALADPASAQAKLARIGTDEDGRHRRGHLEQAMEWYAAFSLLMASFFVLVLLGVPVVFAFFGTNVIFLGYFMGAAGFELLIDSVYGSLSVFVLLPITMFILQGEILFRTGLVTKMIDALDSWLGAVPGRLALLAVGSGTILASLSGASIGTTAMLTRTLAPAMQERGYSKKMSVGPLLGSGGLAVMMPHSALGVILAVIAGVSVGKLLIAIIIPGFLLALCYVIYIVGVCAIDPNEAPKYVAKKVPLNERLVLTVKYVVPLTVLIVAMIAVIFFGVATPTEAASLGTFASFALGGDLPPADMGGHARRHVFDAEDFRDGAGDSRRLASLHATAGLHRLGAKARAARGQPADSADLDHRADALRHPAARRPDRRHSADHDDDPDLHPRGEGARLRPDLVLHRDAVERRAGPDHAAIRHPALRRARDHAEHVDGRDHARRRSDHRHPVDRHGAC